MQGKVARAAAALYAGTMLLTGCGGTENAQQTAGKAGGANGSSASVHGLLIYALIVSILTLF